MTTQTDEYTRHSIDPTAARNLYRAELAMHDARQTQVDESIRAAADRLHEAILLCGLATIAT